jgi:hypothetical protein
MLPDHCKDVSLRRVDFPLTAANIKAYSRGKKAYTRTDHMVLRSGKDLAVIGVSKENGPDLFRPITNVEVISLPDATVFIKDKKVDVLNRSQMAGLALKHPGKTVVVEGMFNHVSFAQETDINYLKVLDVVPPRPAKLAVLVRRALSTGLVHSPVIVSEELIDLNDLAKEARTESMMFPCRASGIRSSGKVKYLDETPHLEEAATLIGCDLSRRIYRSVYKGEPKLINMCPQDLAPKDDAFRMVKCCTVKEGYVLHDRMVVVPWGATVEEVADGINALFRQRSSS